MMVGIQENVSVVGSQILIKLFDDITSKNIRSAERSCQKAPWTEKKLK